MGKIKNALKSIGYGALGTLALASCEKDDTGPGNVEMRIIQNETSNRITLVVGAQAGTPTGAYITISDDDNLQSGEESSDLLDLDIANAEAKQGDQTKKVVPINYAKEITQQDIEDILDGTTVNFFDYVIHNDNGESVAGSADIDPDGEPNSVEVQTTQPVPLMAPAGVKVGKLTGNNITSSEFLGSSQQVLEIAQNGDILTTVSWEGLDPVNNSNIVCDIEVTYVSGEKEVVTFTANIDRNGNVELKQGVNIFPSYGDGMLGNGQPYAQDMVTLTFQNAQVVGTTQAGDVEVYDSDAGDYRSYTDMVNEYQGLLGLASAAQVIGARMSNVNGRSLRGWHYNIEENQLEKNGLIIDIPNGMGKVLGGVIDALADDPRYPFGGTNSFNVPAGHQMETYADVLDRILDLCSEGGGYSSVEAAADQVIEEYLTAPQ